MTQHYTDINGPRKISTNVDLENDGVKEELNIIKALRERMKNPEYHMDADKILTRFELDVLEGLLKLHCIIKFNLTPVTGDSAYQQNCKFSDPSNLSLLSGWTERGLIPPEKCSITTVGHSGLGRLSHWVWALTWGMFSPLPNRLAAIRYHDFAFLASNKPANPKSDTIGWAVYSLFNDSFVKHSCNANVNVQQFANRLYMYSLQPIRRHQALSYNHTGLSYFKHKKADRLKAYQARYWYLGTASCPCKACRPKKDKFLHKPMDWIPRLFRRNAEPNSRDIGSLLQKCKEEDLSVEEWEEARDLSKTISKPSDMQRHQEFIDSVYAKKMEYLKLEAGHIFELLFNNRIGTTLVFSKPTYKGIPFSTLAY